MSAIYSKEIEKHVLSGLIKHPELYPEIAPFVNERDFFDDIHSTIFLIIRSCADKNEKWDKIIIAEKIKNLGISFKNEIDIYHYIDALWFIPINYIGALDASRELKKLRVRRELDTTAVEIQTFVRKNGNLSVDEIVSGVDKIYGEKVSVYEPEDKPVNLFEGLNEMVEERGNNPVEETGLKTAFPEFNRLYGGLRPGNIYAFASRPGSGKTTLLEDLCIKTSQINKTRSFVCDTEMSTSEIRWRTAAARSGVSFWHIESGNWRKNQEMIDKFRASKPINEEYANQNLIYHFSVRKNNIDQVLSIIRRWHKANIKPGQVGIVCYDYLKITAGENVGENWKEYQVLGEKIDKLKRLAEDLNVIILTAIQLNRQGESHNRQGNQVMDDSSTFAISDRLQWFASFTAIFRRKTVDEIVLDGPEFGTHKLIPTKTRFQGRDAAGHQDLVRREIEGKVHYVLNYLNFAVENFDVREIGSLRTILDSQQNNRVPADPNPHDGEPL